MAPIFLGNILNRRFASIIETNEREPTYIALTLVVTPPIRATFAGAHLRVRQTVVRGRREFAMTAHIHHNRYVLVGLVAGAVGGALFGALAGSVLLGIVIGVAI